GLGGGVAGVARDGGGHDGDIRVTAIAAAGVGLGDGTAADDGARRRASNSHRHVGEAAGLYGTGVGRAAPTAIPAARDHVRGVLSGAGVAGGASRHTVATGVARVLATGRRARRCVWEAPGGPAAAAGVARVGPARARSNGARAARAGGGDDGDHGGAADAA